MGCYPPLVASALDCLLAFPEALGTMVVPSKQMLLGLCVIVVIEHELELCLSGSVVSWRTLSVLSKTEGTHLLPLRTDLAAS